MRVDIRVITEERRDERRRKRDERRRMEWLLGGRVLEGRGRKKQGRKRGEWEGEAADNLGV